MGNIYYNSGYKKLACAVVEKAIADAFKGSTKYTIFDLKTFLFESPWVEHAGFDGEWLWEKLYKKFIDKQKLKFAKH